MSRVCYLYKDVSSPSGRSWADIDKDRLKSYQNRKCCQFVIAPGCRHHLGIQHIAQGAAANLARRVANGTRPREVNAVSS